MSDLSRTAAILHERHGELLRARRRFTAREKLAALDALKDERAALLAVEALEAARQRLRGDDGPGRDQLMLDVAGRG